MGLTQDLENILMKSLGDNVSQDAGKGNIPEMAEGLADAIVNFLQQQTFTIVDMKAVVQMESIKTAGPLKADVSPSVTSTVTPGQTVATPTGPGVVSTPGNAVVSNGKNGVIIPPVNLKKKSGQGGVMDSKGYAYIGENPISTSEKNNKHNQTKVKLLRIEKGTK